VVPIRREVRPLSSRSCPRRPWFPLDGPQPGPQDRPQGDLLAVATDRTDLLSARVRDRLLVGSRGFEANRVRRARSTVEFSR